MSTHSFKLNIFNSRHVFKLSTGIKDTLCDVFAVDLLLVIMSVSAANALERYRVLTRREAWKWWLSSGMFRRVRGTTSEKAVILKEYMFDGIKIMNKCRMELLVSTTFTIIKANLHNVLQTVHLELFHRQWPFNNYGSVTAAIFIHYPLTHSHSKQPQTHTHTALVTENSVHDGVIRAADYPAYQKYVFNDIQSFITVTIKAHQRHL